MELPVCLALEGNYIIASGWAVFPFHAGNVSLSKGNIMTKRIEEALKNKNVPTPCLIIDLERVRDNYRTFSEEMDGMAVYYAVKANPHEEILNVLAQEGCNFDCASLAEIDMVLKAGATPDRISFGSTIKKASDIAHAFERGVRLFAFDAEEELHKLSVHAPGSSVFCRILTNLDGAGAAWPLSRKFGCDDHMAISLLLLAAELGLLPRGVSFHVGSQQTDMAPWQTAIWQAAWIFAEVEKHGIHMDLLNLGGGFPTDFGDDLSPTVDKYADSLMQFMENSFPERSMNLIVEPGRALVGDAGIIVSEVVLVARKSEVDSHRWVYLDVGKFHGLAETEDEAIRYPIVSVDVTGEMSPVILAGPTCDSVDTMYEKNLVPLPNNLAAGHKLWIYATGAYTSTYSSVGFNGFPPLSVRLIEDL